MADDTVQRIFKELQENGYWFWSDELIPGAAAGGLAAELKRTRGQFLSILESSNSGNIVTNLLAPLPPLTYNLAIKHAMIATGASVELIDRAKDYIAFHKLKSLNIHLPDGTVKEYHLVKLGPGFTARINNKTLAKASTDLLQDICTIIAFGSRIQEFSGFHSFRAFRLSEICGNLDAIKGHFEALYLEVSPQTKSISIELSGRLSENLVSQKMEKYFKGNSKINKSRDNRVPGIGDEKGERFDIVYEVHPNIGNVIYVAIEVAFQETTNSVIERKGRLARSHFDTFNEKGHYLCFVVDGAGYFSRKKALKDIIRYSHLCVTFKDSQLLRLFQFIENLQSRAS